MNPAVGPVAYTETVSGVNGNGSYHTTVGFVSNATGVWHWVATYGGDPNNNTVASGPLDEPVTIPPQADLALAKTVSNPTPNVGNTISYTVTLTDKGPDAATNAQVTDLLPAGVTFVSATPSQGTYDPGDRAVDRGDGQRRDAADAGDPGDRSPAPASRPIRRRSAIPTSSTPSPRTTPPPPPRPRSRPTSSSPRP